MKGTVFLDVTLYISLCLILRRRQYPDRRASNVTVINVR
jgi:hypothetical protein